MLKTGILWSVYLNFPVFLYGGTQWNSFRTWAKRLNSIWNVLVCYPYRKYFKNRFVTFYFEDCWPVRQKICFQIAKFGLPARKVIYTENCTFNNLFHMHDKAWFPLFVWHLSSTCTNVLYFMQNIEVW